MRKKLFGFLAAGAVAVALPLQALAFNINFAFSVSPTTSGAFSTTTSSNTWDASKTVSKLETDLPSGEIVTAWGSTNSPAAGTTVGSSSVTARWFPFCTSGTFTFNVNWKQPDGGYSETGWTVTAEVNIIQPTLGTNFDGYVLKNNTSGVFKIVVPSVPNLACTGSYTPSQSITLGTFGTNTYKLNQNPSTVGTYTVTMTITYSNGTSDSGSTTYTTT